MNHESGTKDNFNDLINIARQRPIVLFLGAGVNSGFAPLWNKLLKELLSAALRNIPGEVNKNILKKINEQIKRNDDYYIASVIKHLLQGQYHLQLNYQLYGNNGYDRIEFTDMFEQWIAEGRPYEFKYSESNKIKCPTLLFEISDMCSNSSNIHAVVTYNYDEYLSVLINGKRRRIAEDIYHYKQRKKIEEDQLLIYHVHGFIPSHENLVRDEPENIVLAYDEYFQNMIEPYSWQTTSQLHFLMNYTCVFIGASLNDWNMLRVLSNARKYTDATQHYIFFRTEGGKMENIISNRIKATILEESGINVIFCNEFIDIYKKIQVLSKILKKQNKK